MMAASSTVRVSGPQWSSDQESGSTPALLDQPVGRLDARRGRRARPGSRIEPPVSEPIEAYPMPAATAAAEPPLDPPVIRSRFHGLRAGP